MSPVSVGVVLFCLLGIPIRSAAQDAQAPPWEIEFHGGGLFSSMSNDGTGRLPDPGAVFTTLIGTPSRRVSSWYFGDGALLMNQVTLLLGGGGPRITPLDPALIESRLDRDAGGTIGFRLSRRLNNRLRAEF
jgi:hypothetical protein